MLAGFGYVAGYSVLIIATTIAAVFIPERLAPAAPKWLFQVLDSALVIGGGLLVTWLMRVKLNKAPWVGMALPRPQVARLAVGFASGVTLILLVFLVQDQFGWLKVSGVDRLSAAAPRLALGLLPALACAFH